MLPLFVFRALAMAKLCAAKKFPQAGSSRAEPWVFLEKNQHAAMIYKVILYFPSLRKLCHLPMNCKALVPICAKQRETHSWCNWLVFARSIPGRSWLQNVSENSHDFTFLCILHMVLFIPVPPPSCQKHQENCSHENIIWFVCLDKHVPAAARLSSTMSSVADRVVR